jgi:hypothetical protein
MKSALDDVPDQNEIGDQRSSLGRTTREENQIKDDPKRIAASKQCVRSPF